jgi:hypothetical protein
VGLSVGFVEVVLEEVGVGFVVEVLGLGLGVRESVGGLGQVCGRNQFSVDSCWGWEKRTFRAGSSPPHFE